MCSLHDWQKFSILSDGGFVTTKYAPSFDVNVQNIDTIAQMKKKNIEGHVGIIIDFGRVL